MAGMGPSPKKNARRRNVRPDWVKLPAAGRVGDAPTWPLSGRPPKTWVGLWATPQAVMWTSIVRVVARYCRLLVAAEKSDVHPTILSEVRQLEDRLGLSPMAMRRLQWEISADADSPAVEVAPAEVMKLDDYRDLYETG